LFFYMRARFFFAAKFITPQAKYHTPPLQSGWLLSWLGRWLGHMLGGLLLSSLHDDNDNDDAFVSPLPARTPPHPQTNSSTQEGTVPLGWLLLPPNCSLRNIWRRMELKGALTLMTMNMDGSDEVQIYINCRCINIQNKVTYSAELAWVLQSMSRRRLSSSDN
jgi:hypothetical protein